MSITDFLNARISEDEAMARDAYDHDAWELSADDDGDSWVIARDRTGEGWRVAMAPPAPAIHMVNWDPARVLAECAAKRAIVEDVTHSDEDTRDYVIRTLAAVYADHDEYRDEWRVGA